jgi:uncharacterized repeat protein (TIGR01451 family)
MTVTNNGLATDSGVTVTDTLPAGVVFVSSSASQGSCSGTSTVICTLGSMVEGAGATVTIVVTPTVSGPLGNTADVTGSNLNPDPIPVNNTVTINTNVLAVPPSADLALLVADNPDPVTAGQNLTYSITASNNGPDTATNVVVTDTLPSGVTFVSSTASQGACSGIATVTCTLGSLTDGAIATVTIVIKPAASGMLNNTISVTSNVSDPNSANNSVTEGSTVNAAPATGGGGGSGGGYCFIASAAYGSYLAPEVQVLRKFRDDVLLPYSIGRAVVHFYYRTSPPLAEYIRQHESLRIITRWGLTPIVYGIEFPGFSFLIIFGLVMIPILRKHPNKNR